MVKLRCQIKKIPRKEGLSMNSLNTLRLESNTKLKINFEGGQLSSDAGLLLLSEFCSKIGADDLIAKLFQTNDTAAVRRHTDSQNLLQMIYQIFAAYFEDDCADELTTDPVLTAILRKDALASQPTLSRFFNRMDADTLNQFNEILRRLRNTVYSIQKPEYILLDLDTTLLDTYGHQEGEGFNYHYQAHGYHPLMCYDGITGDLLKAELRDGTQYCSNGAAAFMASLLKELISDLPDTQFCMRGDSGFASPDLYETLEENDCYYAIRLKENANLHKLAEDIDNSLYRATKFNQIDYAVEYGEFMYQAATWKHPRRVVFKIEKPYGQIIHKYTFVVTSFEDLEPYQVIQYYASRGKMENFIKESKLGFDFTSVSSHSKTVNANRLQLHVLAYNLFNWFQRLVLPKAMRHLRVDTIRLKLIKIAAKAIRSGRYIQFKLCSSCPYKSEFYETLQNIRQLRPQLE